MDVDPVLAAEYCLEQKFAPFFDGCIKEMMVYGFCDALKQYSMPCKHYEFSVGNASESSIGRFYQGRWFFWGANYLSLEELDIRLLCYFSTTFRFAGKRGWIMQSIKMVFWHYDSIEEYKWMDQNEVFASAFTDNPLVPPVWVGII